MGLIQCEVQSLDKVHFADHSFLKVLKLHISSFNLAHVLKITRVRLKLRWNVTGRFESWKVMWLHQVSFTSKHCKVGLSTTVYTLEYAEL